MDDIPSPSRIDGAGLHALSNQMALILGFSEIVLAATGADDPRRQDLLEIHRAAVECARILTSAQNAPG